MNTPNKITVFRIFLSPVFFTVFFISEWTNGFFIGSVVLCWGIGIIVELTDLLDGYLARKQNLVTDLGKVLDPFADVMSRITYFICFTAVGVMPVWILTILIYRELGITFLRMIMIRRGLTMQANIWGKMKAVTYAVSGVAGMFVVTIDRIGMLSSNRDLFALLAFCIFSVAVFSSVGSFITYALTTVRKIKEQDE